MSNYIDISKLGLEFKNLISGPAPVGRILNYLILTGKGKLYHKNGNRDTTLNNDIGCAWCTEFMVGLNLISYDKNKKQPIKLQLTAEGKALFDRLSPHNIKFDEGINPTKCKNQMKKFIDAYKRFMGIFVTSPVYLNLAAYIDNKKTNKFIKGKPFNSDYWKTFLNEYSNASSFKSNVRTNAGDNRVPSLIQLCLFFDLCVETKTQYNFKIPSIYNKTNSVNSIIDIMNRFNSKNIIDEIDDFDYDNSVRTAKGYDSEEDIEKSNNRKPVFIPGTSVNKRYPTDANLAKTVLRKANFKCELDGFDGKKHETFTSKSGNEYLEAHHLIPMKAQKDKDFENINIDCTANIVPLCPNCHKAVHYGNRQVKIKYLKYLYNKRIKELNKSKINISFDDMIKKYY